MGISNFQKKPLVKSEEYFQSYRKIENLTKNILVSFYVILHFIHGL